jgi:hypothetical protein
MKKYFLPLLLVSAALGQTPNQPPPQLSDPIQLQLEALAQELNHMQRNFIIVDSQIRKENPGFHLTQQLQVEKDAPIPGPATKPITGMPAPSNVVPKKEKQ